MSPIAPGLSSKPSLIERTVNACAAHGLRIAGGNVMHLEEGARTHFFAWLEREHPELVAGISRPVSRKVGSDGVYEGGRARLGRRARQSRKEGQ